AQALLSAAANVNIATQNLVNNGLIQSFNANIMVVQQAARNAELALLAGQLGPQQGAFATLASLHDLFIDSRGGAWGVASGSILIDHGGAQKSNWLAISGGDWLSQTLDLDAGKGQLVMSANNITGVVNVTAGTANVGDISGSMRVGTMNISADPTIWSLN